MVESLKELNKVCQKPNYKTVGNWMVRHILRDAALPVTWVLLHTPVSANQVTLFSLLIGLLGGAMLGCRSLSYYLIGTLLLQLWYLLDHVDGQIARYRKTASLTGRFFDFLMHHLVHGVVLFFLGFYVYRIKDENIFVLWGFIATLSMIIFNMIHDIKYKTFFEKIYGEERIEIIQNKSNASDDPSEDEKKGILKLIFSIVHKCCEMHVLMNILTVAAFLQIISNSVIDFRANLFMVYGIMAPFIAIVKITYFIKTKRIDQEFSESFKI